MDLDNCSNCGRVYAKNIKRLCPICMKSLEEDYAKCVAYLRKNKKCDKETLSEATGVSTKHITMFILEGRFDTFTVEGLECTVCGTAIKQGKICESCRTRLTKDTQVMHEIEEIKARNAAEKTHISGYQIKDRWE